MIEKKITIKEAIKRLKKYTKKTKEDIIKFNKEEEKRLNY